MENNPHNNNSEREYRGDEKIVRKFLKNKFIAVIVVLGIIFFAFSQLIDNVVKTKENLPKLFSEDTSNQDSGEEIKQINSLDETPIKVKQPIGTTLIVKPIVLPKEEDFFLKKIELNDKVIDENGEGIEGVEIWCKNCLSQERVISDKNGSFSLHREFKINDEVNYQIVICFRYKKQSDCKTSQFKYINQIEIPKFIKK